MTKAFLPLILPALLAAPVSGQTPDTVQLKPDATPPSSPQGQAPAQTPSKPAAPKAEPAKKALAPIAELPAIPTGSLSFFSQSYPFAWDRLIPVDAKLDGLQVKSIFFNVRKPNVPLIRSTEWGTRAQVEVANTGTRSRIPGFAVAVLDSEGKLLGVASGGTKVGSVKAGETETFDLDFTQVKERLPKGEKFILSIELRN